MSNKRKTTKSKSNREKGKFGDLPVSAKQFRARAERVKGGARITVTAHQPASPKNTFI
jgi:hypothetical protein